MNKTIEALKNGQVVKFNSVHPRYYKMVNGKLYFSDVNEDYSQWKKSNAKMGVFHDESQWIIL